MQMDSYYYGSFFHDDAPFYPHGGAAPASPELLPFDFDLAAAASPGDLAPPPSPPRPSTFQDYSGGAAGPELLQTGAAQAYPFQGSAMDVHGRVIVDALGRMGGGDQEGQSQQAAMAVDDGAEELDAAPPPPPQQQPHWQAAGAVESSRGFRHMMRERQRREKLSQSYADLYAMVSARSRGDKNSIVQSAAAYVRELRGARDQLRARNEELRARILGRDAARDGVAVQFEVADAASPADSMVAALRRLRSMGVRATSIRSSASGRRLCTQMTVETTIAAAEVEKAVEEALMQEVERNQHPEPEPGSGPAGLPGTSSSTTTREWGPQHVQNVF